MPHGNGISEGKFILKKGKLIKVHAVFEDSTIKRIKITGDFFIYPEEIIENLEKALENTSVDEAYSKIRESMQKCEYIGIDPDSLYEAVKNAWMKRS